MILLGCYYVKMSCVFYETKLAEEDDHARMHFSRLLLS